MSLSATTKTAFQHVHTSRGAVIVRKIQDGVCVEVRIPSAYLAMAKRMAGVEPGACAELGYTRVVGAQQIHVPFVGEIEAPLYAQGEQTS